MILGLLLTLALQTGSDPSEPPEPPVVEMAPARPSPPRPPSPSLAPSRVVPAPDAMHGSDDATTIVVQVSAGISACCLVSIAALPLGLIPIAGAILYSAVVGGVTGGTEAVVGDIAGRKRGNLGLAVGIGVGVSVVGLLVAEIWWRLVPPSIDNAIYVDSRRGIVVHPNVVVAPIASIVAVVVPVIVWQLTAVDKEPGDTGGFPGLFGPADQTETRGAGER